MARLTAMVRKPPQPLRATAMIAGNARHKKRKRWLCNDSILSTQFPRINRRAIWAPMLPCSRLKGGIIIDAPPHTSLACIKRPNNSTSPSRLLHNKHDRIATFLRLPPSAFRAPSGFAVQHRCSMRTKEQTALSNRTRTLVRRILDVVFLLLLLLPFFSFSLLSVSLLSLCFFHPGLSHCHVYAVPRTVDIMAPVKATSNTYNTTTRGGRSKARQSRGGNGAYCAVLYGRTTPTSRPPWHSALHP